MSNSKAAFPCCLRVSSAPGAPPSALSFPYDRLTLTLILTDSVPEAEFNQFLSNVRNLERIDGCPKLLVRMIVAGTGEVLERVKDHRVETYWLNAEASPVPQVEGWGALFIMRGKTVLAKATPVPKDIKGMIPKTTLTGLAEKIENGDTSELIAVYTQAKSVYSDLGTEGIDLLLSSISGLWGIDLTSAKSWFESYKSPIGDPHDIINPKDISFKHFCRRLLSYCLHSAPIDKPASKDSSPLTLVENSRVAALESQLKSVRNELRERDRVVFQLKTDLKLAEYRIAELTAHNRTSELGFKHRISSQENLIGLEEVALDEADQDSPVISVSQVEQSGSAKASQSWKDSPTIKGRLGVPGTKTVSLSPGLSATSSLIISPMLNLRPVIPSAKDRKKSPQRSMTKNLTKAAQKTNSVLKKLEATDRAVLQQAGKLTFRS